MHVLNAYLQTVVKRFYVLNYQMDIYRKYNTKMSCEREL